jgi:hypothetical protein
MGWRAVESIQRGEQVECVLCGETLVRIAVTDHSAHDFVEAASQGEHRCWDRLPDGAELLRLD